MVQGMMESAVVGTSTTVSESSAGTAVWQMQTQVCVELPEQALKMIKKVSINIERNSLLALLLILL